MSGTMPHATPTRSNRRGTLVKHDPDPLPTVSEQEATQTVPNSQSEGSFSNESAGDASVRTPNLNPNQSFYRDGRSGAPAPSDRIADDVSEPLFREMRIRSHLAAARSPTAADGSFTFHTSFQDIGKKLKACNDTLGELQGLGVSHDVPLPELVLVGDQSAGKSSVMSGLANLDLPRSEGTCTRCPLHIRVSHNNEWSCRVSLSKEYTYEPPTDRPVSEADVTDQAPFFPWRRLPTTQILDFKTLQSPTAIEDVLRWAQVAILNDQKPHGMFIPGSGSVATNMSIDQAAQETAAKFSPNVVSLEIKGPELPNLSFYDLPGIFQNPANARDDYLVSVVTNLSSSYIRRPSAIIMCSSQMNSDAENSYSLGLTRKLGASRRTIGVLTKADLLPPGGNHQQWLAIMKGEAHQTGLGYFITSRKPGMDLEALKTHEQEMFESHADCDWPSPFHQFSGRCGVEKLKAFLSEKLAEEFAKSLPHIEHKVKLHLDKINRQLANLPELPDNVELEVQRSLLKFNEAARSAVGNCVRHLNKLSRDFQTCLLKIHPKFILRDKSDTPVHEIYEIPDDESDTESVATPAVTPSKRRNMAPPHTPAKRHRGITPSTNGGSFVKPEESDANSVASPRRWQPPELAQPFTKFARVGGGFRTLGQVREEIQQKTAAGVPDLIPREVYEDLALESIQPWAGPVEAYLDETMERLGRELTVALNESFDALKKRLVFGEARKHLKAFLNTHRIKARNELTRLHRIELRRLLTFNEEAFQRHRDYELNLLTRFRHKMRMESKGLLEPRPLDMWEKMTGAQKKDEKKKREEDLAKIGPDQFEREIQVISYVRGYYKLAALRFAENVAQCIICQMIPDVKEELSLYLNTEMGLLPGASRDVYEKLMEEDSTVAAKRNTLKSEREKFEKALASIEALNTGPSDTEYGGSFSARDEIIVDDATLADDGI